MALDQGTTTSRAVLIDHNGAVAGMAQNPFEQRYPKPGWVGHNPQDILSSQFSAFTELLVSSGVLPEQIDSIGIANQRETTLVWDKETGIPIADAIVWQCRRSAPIVEELCANPAVAARIKEKTGLLPDAYFSASKIAWLLNTVPGARARAEAGGLAFGTVDSWLIWSLTNGAVHVTDPTNASRTMLYNIHENAWDAELLELFNIPASMLPEVRPSASVFGETAAPSIAPGIPIAGVAGDQQAALFGQCCFSAGEAKNTYGTGCFLLMHTGKTPCASEHGLVTTIAASAPGTQGVEYALEGSVFVGGALVQWLRDEMGLVATAAETETLARSVADSAGVYVVPAFTGLGAPYWDAEARGAIFGLTRGASRAHIVRASLEAIAYQVTDLVFAMEADAPVQFRNLKVDGGASANDFLMQFQANMLQAPIVRPHNTESTALGAAFLAGLTTGFWESTEELRALSADAMRFEPNMPVDERNTLLAGWAEAVGRTKSRP